MDPLPALSGIVGATRVQDRNGGSRRDAAAFRRAMDEQAGQPGGEEAAAEAGGGEQPMRRALQPRAVDGRRDRGATHRHVDVIA